MEQTGQIAPDGNHYWDGQRWVSTLSADGHWRWDGTSWVPAKATGVSINPGVLAHQSAHPTYPQPSPIYASPVLVYRPPTNSWAVVSMVFGIISWFLCPFVGGIVAVISGHVGHSQIKQSGEGGSGMATAGLVLGYIHLAAFALIALFWTFLFGGLAILAGSAGGTSHP